jgi:hypothetical protein
VTCKDGCCRVDGAADPCSCQSRIGVSGAAACTCYPANDECPSSAACAPQGHPEYLSLADEIRRLHVLKSGGYGTGPDPFANFTAVASLTGQPRYLYPAHRSIEKLTRVLSLHAQGRTAELEEEFLDVASLLLCAAAMLRDDTP